jgi:DNA-binding CsgD family transcriptional regulator
LDDRLSDAARRIEDAPLDPSSWPDVLGAMAAAVGGWSGQLLAASDRKFRFYLASETPEDLVQEYAARGGADPAFNPRAAAVDRAPVMRPFCDPHFISEQDRLRHPLYQEFFDKADAPYSSMALLAAEGGFKIVTAVNRSRRQGPAEGPDQERFAALLPHLRRAAALQLRLESQAAALALGALEQLTLPAVFCAADGRIAGVSHDADLVLAAGRFARQQNGRLRGACGVADRELQEAITRAAAPDIRAAPKGSSILLWDADGAEFMVADISPLPRGKGSFGLAAQVVVTLGERRTPRPTQLLTRLGLTESEAEVASAMAAGRSPAEIAIAREVSLGTVRAQTKSIYAKLGVRRQSELGAALRRLI